MQFVFSLPRIYLHTWHFPPVSTACSRADPCITSAFMWRVKISTLSLPPSLSHSLTHWKRKAHRKITDSFYCVRRVCAVTALIQWMSNVKCVDFGLYVNLLRGDSLKLQLHHQLQMKWTFNKRSLPFYRTESTCEHGI